MRIIAVTSTKGGVGKTTLAVQLAAAAAAAGRKVWLVDGDAQGSALASITNRADRHDLPQISASQYADGRTLRAQVLAQAENFDLIVIDCGGRDSSAMRAALMLADLAIVPFRPRSYDVWAISETADLVAQAQAQRDGLEVKLLLNAADPGAFGALAGDNAQALEAANELPTLAAFLGNRKAFSSASAAGLAVSEMPKRDVRACIEISALYREIGLLEV